MSKGLQVYDKKWGNTKPIQVNIRVKRVIVPGRLVEIRKSFFTSKVPGMAKAGNGS